MSGPVAPCLCFVSKNGGFIKPKDKGAIELTNLLLDGTRGGRIHLKESDYDEFLSLYANDIENGWRLAVVECRTPVFRFYIDMDMLFSRELLDTQIHAYMRTVISSVVPFFVTAPESLLVSICLRAPCKPTSCGGIKNGLHIIFPKLFVTTLEALAIRANIVANLMLEYGDDALHGEDTWEKAVDSTVYVSAGLRMPGSIKVVACSHCDKNTRETCGECAGCGKMDEKRPYTFWGAFDNMGNTHDQYNEALGKSFLKLVMLTSIRSYETCITKHFKRFVGAPSFVQPMLTQKRPPALGKRKELPEDRKACIGWKKTRRIVEDAQIKNTCQNLVRHRVNQKRYSKLLVLEVHTDSSNTFYDVKVRGEGSSFCQNKLSDHNNNTIYFRITRAGITQRCFCRCPINRIQTDAPCRQYSSPSCELVDDEVTLLFGTSSSQGN
eukprot:6214145-Pleurochrysis_carterae.AAC.1